MTYLARQNGYRVCGLSEIAESGKMPPVYLRKLLGELRRNRIIESIKGVNGGYALAQSPQEITLWDVFRVLDHDPYMDECILCRSRDGNSACPFCGEWKRIRDELIHLLQTKTIADFAESASLGN